MDFRKCGGVETVASIVSGGSIVKPGKKDGANILDQWRGRDPWRGRGGGSGRGASPRLRARGTV